MSYTNIDNIILDCKELNIQEQSLLIALNSFNNKEKGYAWPSYGQLMIRSKIKTEDTLIKTIKSLENKKLIGRISRKGKVNYYYLLPIKMGYPYKQGIHKNEDAPTPILEGNSPQKLGTINTNTITKINTIKEEDILQGENYIRVIEEYKNCVSVNITNKEIAFIKEQLLIVGEEVLIKAFEVACKRNGKNIDYVLTLIKDWKRNGLETVGDIEGYLSKRQKKRLEYKSKDTCISSNGKTQPTINNNLKFNNFEQREYDFDSLEKKLLGWD